VKSETTFVQLVESIQNAHSELTAQAGRAVNISLTLRNWLIGYYIAEYEMNGKDRADYGDRLLDRLAAELTGVKNCNRRQLYDYLRFYRTYPAIVRSLSAQFRALIPESLVLPPPIVPKVSAQSTVPLETLFRQLSYSHLRLLTDLWDETQRAFYETECIRGNWSVRELKRQIASLYYERSGLSHDKQKLAELAQQGAQTQPAIDIRDPYIFEFLGLKPAEVMSESYLEQQLTDKLQVFLLELVPHSTLFCVLSAARSGQMRGARVQE